MKLALGTAQFGLTYGVANRTGMISHAELVKVLGVAAEAGVDTLDTAIAYGESEKNLGQCQIEDFDVITKVPEIPTGAVPSKWLENAIMCSLRRLKKERLEALLLHRPLQLLGPLGAQIYDALLMAKKNNLVNKVGISVYSPDELDLLYPKYELDIIQAPFSIFDRRLLTSGWLHKLHQSGAEVHARSVFLQGLLVMPASERPAYFNKWSSLWDCYEQWLTLQSLEPQEACLRYALSIKEITKVIVGVDSLEQFNQTLGYTGLPKLDVPDNISSEDTGLLNPGMWKI